MWTKITKTFAAAVAITTALLITLAIPATTSAHGPENHKGLCTAEILDQWHDNAGPCDPSNPPNILAGITNNEGSTTKDYPNGLCYPSFNNYTDMIDNRFLDDFGVEIGMDPYGTNPPLFKDERNFLKVRKTDESAEWADYKDAVSVQDGDELTFMIYLHNDGDPCLNDNIDLPSGKFYSDWNTTSHDTKVKITGDFIQENANIFSKFDAKKDFNANIWSNDAVNGGGSVAPITNNVSITPIGGKEMKLKFRDSTVFYTDYNAQWNYQEHSMENGKDLFKSTGMLLSTLTNGNVKGSAGDYYASEPYIGVIVLKFDVEEIIPQVCTNLVIEREGSKLYNGEETAYKIRVAKMEFGTDPIPAGTQVKWTTTDPSGKFWLGNEATDEGTWADPDFQQLLPASVLWSQQTITTNSDDYVYYIGTGTVSASVDTVDDSLETTLCEDSVVIPVVEAVCDDLQVDHPQTITEGTLSWFRADALDTNDEEFAGPITYSVTPGYGYFYTTKPAGYTDNESPTVYEPEIAYIPFWDLIGTDVILTGAELIEGTDDDEGTDYTIDPGTLDALVSSIATGNFWSVSPSGIHNPGDLVDPADLYEVNDSVIDLPATAGPDPNPIANPGTMDSQIMNLGTTSLTEGIQNNPGTMDLGTQHNNLGTMNPSSFAQISVFDIPEKDPTDLGATGINTPDYSEIVDHDISTTTYTLPKIQNNDVDYTLGNVLLPKEDYSITPDYSGLLDHDVLTVQPGLIDLDQDMIDLSLSTITVEQGDIVYFYAKKPGTNVITVKTTDSDEADCERKFSIIAAPVIETLDCASAKLTAETTSKIYPTCMSEENGKVSLNVSFTSTADQLINTADVQVKWTATKPGFEYNGGEIHTAIQNQFVNGVSTHYTGSGSVTASLFTLEGEPYDGDASCTVTIPACDAPPLCAQLDLTSDPLAPFVGDDVTLTASGKDTFGTDLPNTTIIEWSNTAGGELETSDQDYGNQSSVSADLGDIITFRYSTQAGEVTAAIAAEDPMFSEVCKNSIPIVEVPSNLVCVELAATVTKIDGGEVNALMPGEEYVLEAAATYSEEYPTGTLTYSIDPSVGFFYKLAQTELDPENIGTGDEGIPPFIQGLFENAADFAQENGYMLPIFESTIIVYESEDVYLVTFDEEINTTSIQNALIMEASGFPNCIEYYDLIVLPGNQEWACVDLDIVKPNSNWDIDDKDDEQSVKIEVETTPSGHEDELYYHWELSGVNDEEWDENGDDEHVDIGDTTQKFTWDKDTGEPLIRVWASYEEDGDEIAACEDWVRADIDDDEEEDEPKFLKKAYINDNRHDISDADDEINIGSGSSNQDLTYIYTFIAGDSDIDWVKIEDKDFTNAKTIKGNKNGNLKYKGMRINVQDGSNKYTILEEGDYDREDDDDKYDEDNDYENEYSCGSNDFCLDYNDFDDAANDFVKGGELKFENIESDMVIMIKVQVENNTKINTAYCADLTTAEGCGEEFNNEASYKTPDYNGRADATIIAVCPYVLTRSGGDVFFHDVVDTGIDVSYCSPVKSSTGTGITKNPTENAKVTSTGYDPTDENPNAVLTLPTHDVCQYSNSNITDNMEEYKNPLSNFSSTICELRAEVSENWQETHIKNSIAANIARIARWGGNTVGNPKISSIGDLPETVKNGVYFTTDNFEIDLSNTAGLSNGNPAAKTFIIMGADLTISSDIIATLETPGKPSTVPSFAFIVIDGNIIIDKDVERIDGVLMAIDLNLDENGTEDGKIKSEGTTQTHTLVINGSLFGDVYDLFEKRQAIGDPRKDEGSVTIRYDERILLNTPPGISELVDVATTLVP